ncbi:acyltransferase [Prevotella sp. 10(H)]|uniref:acyltransferase family protein n=1 Tax=Prevotella sp. 10(H) TaxID=1158294 RepID=UPI0004A77887|nr:acyltransferase [Prevotella sp. 10(H)]
MEVKKYEYIDSLRGIAILLVVLVHVQYIEGFTSSISYFSTTAFQFMANGHLGVSLFFIVSAFTLMMSHQRRQYEDHANRNFFIRRFFRIAPMYYLAIVYFTFAYFVGFDFANIDWSNVPKKELILNVLFVNGFFPEYIHHYVPGGWSITVEFTFYALFPLLFARLKTINQVISFTLISLLISTVFNLLLKGTGADINNFLGYYIVAQLPVFSLGILAYRLVSVKEEIMNVKLSSLSFLAVTIFVYCYTAISYDFLYSIVFFLLLIILSQKAYKLFSNKILAKIGKVSFSLYLVHFAMMTVFNMFGCFRWVEPYIKDKTTAYLFFIFGYICLFAVSFLLSNITYRLIEMPGQNLGRKLIKKLDQQK